MRIEPNAGNTDEAQVHQLFVAGRSLEAMMLVHRMCDTFIAATTTAELKVTAPALARVALTVRDWGESERALEIYDRIIDRLAGSRSPTLRRAVALALIGKRSVLSDLGQIAELRKVSTLLIEDFGDDAIAAQRELAEHAANLGCPNARRCVTGARLQEVGLLAEMGRVDEAVEVLGPLADEDPVVSGELIRLVALTADTMLAKLSA